MPRKAATKATQNASKTKARKINFDPQKKVNYLIEVSQNEWDKLKPDPVSRQDRDTYNLKDGWTFFIIKKLWTLYKMRCPFAFKKHYFPAKKCNPYLTFFGKCQECGNPINGFIAQEPQSGSPIILVIETHDTSDLAHKQCINLAGDRRREIQTELENTKPKKYEDSEAAEVLNDSGTKIPYFVTKAVARTARQQARDKKIGIDKYSSDAVTAILEMMDDECGIHEFSVDPLKIYYWFDNQNTLWNEAAEMNMAISIDASGSVNTRPTIIDDQKSDPIFIYNVTLRVDGEVYSLCQMLSSIHDTISIAKWLQAWIDRGAQIPKQAYVDCSWALLGAMCIVFNLCGYFEYNDKCHVWLQEHKAKLKMRKKPTDVIVMHNVLPPCRVMRDRAHLIKSACRWKCFSILQNWTKKDFYVRIIAYCLEIQNTEELEKVIVALLVVCESEIVDKGSNCYEEYNYLADKIKSFNHQCFKQNNNIDEVHACSEEHCSFLKEFDDEKLDWVTESTGNIKSYLLKLQEKSNGLLKEDKAKKYSEPNSYWLPAIKNNLLRLFKEYPSWTNTTLSHYPFKPDPVASSTGSELYFKILKIDYKLVSLSIQRFLIQHLKLLNGATKNGRRNLLLFKEKKKALEEEEKEVFEEKDKKKVFEKEEQIRLERKVEKSDNESLLILNSVSNKTPICEKKVLKKEEQIALERKVDKSDDESLVILNSVSNKTAVCEIDCKKKVLEKEEQTALGKKVKNSDNESLVILDSISNKTAVCEIDSVATNFDAHYIQPFCLEKNIDCNPRIHEMMYNGILVSTLQTNSDIIRLFNINNGVDFQYDLLISYYNYNLPYNIKDEGCTLTLNAFMSLKEKQFVHGEVIDSVMSIFKHRSEWQDVFFIPTSQSTFILGDQCDFDHPSDWIMYNLEFEFDGVVFIPFTRGLHWSLIMLDVAKKKLYYFDPKYDFTKTDALRRIRLYFERCYEIGFEKYGGCHTQNLSLIKWEVTEFPSDCALKNLPRQDDSHSCGPFIIYFMAILTGINEVTNFDPDLYRYCIADMLIKHFSTDNICLLCYNDKGDFPVYECITCRRWAHINCAKRWKAKVQTGVCEICTFCEKNSS